MQDVPIADVFGILVKIAEFLPVDNKDCYSLKRVCPLVERPMLPMAERALVNLPAGEAARKSHSSRPPSDLGATDVITLCDGGHWCGQAASGIQRNASCAVIQLGISQQRLLID